MRTFVAITTPSAGPVPVFLDRCRTRLDASRPDVKWVAAPQRHLTLRFLGEVDEGFLDSIKQAILNAAMVSIPFEAFLVGWGAFPGTFRPQTLWAAVSADGNALQHVDTALAERLRAIGIPPETKPFHPHITLGRVRSPRGLDALVRALKSPCPSTDGAAFAVDHLTLFKSVLLPSGPEYTELLSAPFGAGQNPES